MVDTFKLASTPTLHFGVGKRKLLPKTITKYGTNILLVTGASSLTSSPFWDEIRNDLNDHKIQFEHAIIPGEPTPKLIDTITDQFDRIECVVAIGGGSVLDAGKAISAMLCTEGSVKEYLEGVGTKTPTGAKVPFIALPTTSGTGSEATKNAVISEVGENGFKKSLRHDNYVPDVAIIDPELTIGCSPSLTAHTGMDAFTQLLESYVSTNASLLTDSVAVKGLHCVRSGLIEAYENGSNLTARSDMAYASMISGITLANAGLGTVHGFASAIGGFFDIPHGVVCGTLMGSTNTHTLKSIRKEKVGEYAIKKYVRVGKIFARHFDKTDDYYRDFLLDTIHEYTDRMQVSKLSEFGVTSDDFKKIIEKTGNKNNPVDLSSEVLSEILEERL